MFRTYRILIIFGLLVAVVVAGNALLKETPPEPGRYYNDEHKFSIKFPEGWEITSEFGGKSIIAVCPVNEETDNFSKVVQVIIQDLPFRPKLDFFFDALLSEYRRNMGTSIQETGDVVISDTKAKWATIHMFKEGQKAQTLINCMVKGKKGYMIQCVAEPDNFSEHKNIFDMAVQSFKYE